MLLIPKFTTVGDHAFLADDTLVGCYELGGGWIRVGARQDRQARLRRQLRHGGARPQGAQGVAGRRALRRAGARRRQGRLVAGSAARRPGCAVRRPAATTPAPTPRRPGCGSRAALVERCASSRCCCSASSSPGWRSRSALLMRRRCWPRCSSPARCCSLAGIVGRAGRRVVAKWLLVGRHRRRRPPAVVVVRVAQRAGRHLHRGARRTVVRRPRRRARSRSTSGCACSARGSGAASGATPTGCPRPTWSRLDDGATVNRGCVVQTHLFHDRVLSMDDGGPQGRRDPRAQQRYPARPRRSAGTRPSGPVSLVMRGEGVPSRTCWIGNPIGPWEAEVAATIRGDDDCAYVPDHGDDSFDVTPLLAGPGLQGRRQPARRRRAADLRRARRHHLGRRSTWPHLAASPRCCSTAGRPASRTARNAARRTRRRRRPGDGVRAPRHVRRQPRARCKRAAPRRRRVGGADRRRHRRGPAARRADLVPLQRPARATRRPTRSRWPRPQDYYVAMSRRARPTRTPARLGRRVDLRDDARRWRPTSRPCQIGRYDVARPGDHGRRGGAAPTSRGAGVRRLVRRGSRR